jgi:hypothetical protein
MESEQEKQKAVFGRKTIGEATVNYGRCEYNV